MVIIDHLTTAKPKVKWIESIDSVPLNFENKNVKFFRKCLFNELTLVIGDYILVSNADAADPDTVSGCDVAEVLHLYELKDLSAKDTHRAIVQWYSRPECIPHRVFDSDNICIDFNCEVIQDHRAYDADISLETIFRKCKVIIGSVSDSAPELLQHISSNTNCPMFVCRYKFVKVKQSYKLIPLESISEINVADANRKKPSGKSVYESAVAESTMSSKRDTGDIAATVEFIDINEISNKNKVSPIKIIGGKRVVRLSSRGSSKHELKNDSICSPRLPEKIIKCNHLTKIDCSVCRKSNLGLTDDNSTINFGCSNCTTIKNRPVLDRDGLGSKSMKIKLCASERKRSTRLVSFDDDPLHIADKPEDNHQLYRNHVAKNFSDIYSTPIKKSKEFKTEITPSVLKSILKSTDSQTEFELKNFSFDGNSHANRKKLVAGGFCIENDNSVNASLTPNKNLIRSRNLTPIIFERQALTTPKSTYSLKSDLKVARESLHVSVVPTSLPCRENEFKNIYTFLEGKIQDQCGGCMYVSGVPGTGKTATVTSVINLLQRQAAEGYISDFEYIEINGMRLTEPRQAYVQLYKQLTGKTLSWEHAHSRLEKRFTTPAHRRVTTVLLVDELDILCNRRQDVVYNILDWPTKSFARLVVVTIANTLDLPERLLMGKVTSRLGLTRLTFQPYTHKQLQEIVTARLGGKNEAFKSDAVQLVARKVAAVSGDARRALDICRRATEIADNAAIKSDCVGTFSVNMMHVQQALSEMIASAKVQAIINCSRMEQIFLQAAVAEITRTGVEETSFIGVYIQMETITAFLGTGMPSTGRALRICSKLGSQHLIISEHSQNDIYQKIFLNVSVDDIHYALKVNNS